MIEQGEAHRAPYVSTTLQHRLSREQEYKRIGRIRRRILTFLLKEVPVPTFDLLARNALKEQKTVKQAEFEFKRIKPIIPPQKNRT